MDKETLKRGLRLRKVTEYATTAEKWGFATQVIDDGENLPLLTVKSKKKLLETLKELEINEEELNLANKRIWVKVDGEWLNL